MCRTAESCGDVVLRTYSIRKYIQSYAKHCELPSKSVTCVGPLDWDCYCTSSSCKRTCSLRPLKIRKVAASSHKSPFERFLLGARGVAVGPLFLWYAPAVKMLLCEVASTNGATDRPFVTVTVIVYKKRFTIYYFISFEA